MNNNGYLIYQAERPVGAENLCHQVIFMNHASGAVTALDPELVQVGDDQLAAFVAQPSPPFAQLDVTAIREGIAQRARQRSRGPEMQAVHELRIGALPARVYRPAAGRIPLVVYLHGGGWTIGNLESHDRMCRRLEARLSECHGPTCESGDDTVASAPVPGAGQRLTARPERVPEVRLYRLACSSLDRPGSGGTRPMLRAPIARLRRMLAVRLRTSRRVQVSRCR